jgi:RNA-directed DNA polymerase
VFIPKPGSDEKRLLKLRSIITRVVAAAIARALTTYLESSFLDGSHGFRQNRNCWTLLVSIQLAIETSGWYFLASADVHHAFDVVRVDAAMELLQQRTTHQEYLRLVQRLLLGPEEQNLGIDQGSGISPLILLLVLHEFLDTKLRDQEDILFWGRYVDNLFILTRSMPEGEQAVQYAKDLMNATDMPLKDDYSVIDLRKESQFVLGFDVSAKDGKVRYQVPDEAWKDLGTRLRDAHHKEDPPQQAKAIVEGWMNYFGPAWYSLQGRRRSRACNRITNMTVRYGFREISQSTVIRHMEKATKDWSSLLGDMRNYSASPPAADGDLPESRAPDCPTTGPVPLS